MTSNSTAITMHTTETNGNMLLRILGAQNVTQTNVQRELQ